jgi:putative transposase
MKYPLVRDLADDGIPVSVTCRVLKFSTQGYYRWLKKPVTRRDYENAYLTNAALDAHESDPTFGYRFISDELEGQGHMASERRVWRLCSDQRIWSSFVKKSRSGKKPGPPVHDDLVQRDFEVDEINALWFTDITEHPTGEGKLYLCSLMDACSTRLVGYSIGDRMTADLAVSALHNAIALRDPEGTTVHSDSQNVRASCPGCLDPHSDRRVRMSGDQLPRVA